MALDSHTQAAVAPNRFGFMSKAGVPSDPRPARLADLANPTAGRVASHELPSAGEVARATFAFPQERYWTWPACFCPVARHSVKSAEAEKLLQARISISPAVEIGDRSRLSKPYWSTSYRELKTIRSGLQTGHV
jgi:hypothetical protein